MEPSPSFGAAAGLKGQEVDPGRTPAFPTRSLPSYSSGMFNVESRSSLAVIFAASVALVVGGIYRLIGFAVHRENEEAGRASW